MALTTNENSSCPRASAYAARTGDPDCVRIDAENEGRVLFFLDCEEGTRVEGIEIFHGNAVQVEGGGAYAENSNLAFSHCRFKDNALDHPVIGGGIFARETTIRMEDCEFINNLAAADNGSAINARSDTEPAADLHLIRCTFTDNIAFDGNSATIFFIGNALNVEDCVFSENESFGIASCIHSEGGALSVTGSEFLQNNSRYGPVISCYSDEALIQGSQFLYNDSWDEGGPGALGIGSSTVTAEVTDCVFAGNMGYRTGAGRHRCRSLHTAQLLLCRQHHLSLGR